MFVGSLGHTGSDLPGSKLKHGLGCRRDLHLGICVPRDVKRRRLDTRLLKRDAFGLQEPFAPFNQTFIPDVVLGFQIPVQCPLHAVEDSAGGVSFGVTHRLLSRNRVLAALLVVPADRPGHNMSRHVRTILDLPRTARQAGVSRIGAGPPAGKSTSCRRWL